MTASVHLRGIVIAGVLAAVALALGFVTLAMNQTASQASPHKILPLKLRHHPAHVVTKGAAKSSAKPSVHVRHASKPKPRVSPLFVAALKAGLPRSVASALATNRAVVVELTSGSDPVAQLAAGEAKAAAALAGAGYVAVNVDRDGGDIEVMTRLLGKLPIAPAALVYTRPASLSMTLTGFNDRTVVQQAVQTALTAGTAATSTTTTPAPSTTAATTTSPAAPAASASAATPTP